MMRIIGITGGVGSGKSKVLSYLAEKYDAIICEADKVSYELQQPGNSCYEEIVAYFGNKILKNDKTIDRNLLGKIVFSNEEKRKQLNQIVHPKVKIEILNRIKKERLQETKYFVIEAALLIEDHYDEVCDELWYIFAEPKIRTQRLINARGYTKEKVAAIMNSQASDSLFREKCDKVINNNKNFEITKKNIDKILKIEDGLT